MLSLFSKICSSSRILDKIQTGIFVISGYMVENLTSKNFPNSRTVCAEPLMILPWNLQHDLELTKKMLAGYDVIVIFSNLRPILNNPEVKILMHSPQLFFSLITTFYLREIEKRIKKFLTQPSFYCCKKIFLAKILTFTKAMLTSVKSTGSFNCKVYFLKLQMSLYLHTKVQVSSTILTSFRQGVILSQPS